MPLETKMHMAPSQTGLALVVNRPTERTIYSRQRPVRGGQASGSELAIGMECGWGEGTWSPASTESQRAEEGRLAGPRPGAAGRTRSGQSQRLGAGRRWRAVSGPSRSPRGLANTPLMQTLP